MSSEAYFRDLPEAPPLWRRLARDLYERVHPPPEPDLHLESKPVRVKDIWTHGSSARQRAGSLAIHAAIIGVLMLPFWHPVQKMVRQEAVDLVMPMVSAPAPAGPKMHRLAGGGAPHPIAPPRVQPEQTPPMTITPPLALIPPTTMANISLPQLGNIGAITGPPGVNSGSGGNGAGGTGNGGGGGDCVAGPCGTGGGDITSPVAIYDPDPEYSDAARKAKFQGTVIVDVVIGVDGHVYNPKIVQSVGLGLDEKAIEAVKTWRFEPAKRHGQPIRVAADIEVNFHLY